MKKRLLLLALAAVLSLSVAALAQEGRAAQIDAELQPLLERQSELYEKVSQAFPAIAEPGVDDAYAPEKVRALGVLTSEEEAFFNETYAQINTLYAGFPAIEQEWLANQDNPAAEEQMLEQTDQLNQQADALWTQLLPLTLKLDTALSRVRLLDIGLSAEETDTYLDVDNRAYQLRVQADQLYEGWGQASESGRADIERQAAALQDQAEQLKNSIPEINDKINHLENDRYYAGLTALSSEEQQELRGLDERILALYEELYQLMESPNT